MKKYLPQPKYQAVSGSSDLFCLLEDYQLEHDGFLYKIKAGYRNDGASIPRIFWPFTGHPMEPDGLPAALVHDILYGSEHFPREYADLVYKQLLERNHMSAFRATARYRFLRIVGGITWRTHTDETRARARKYLTVIPIGQVC